mmetsp:Transcript_52229/g.167419  ORF Transcript_52229/g.167419 Transcript_52229/m.167419 type:complete len:348 (-) Transcript_52229:1392-2435(-)
MALHALLLAHGVEHAVGGAAMAGHLLLGLAEAQRNVDAPVLDLLGLLRLRVLRLLALAAGGDPTDAVDHALLLGLRLDQGLLRRRRTGAPRAHALARGLGLPGLEAVEVDHGELLALRARRRDQLDGRQGGVDLLVLQAAARSRPGSFGRALHGEAHEVAAVQLAGLVLLQGVQEVLHRVLPGAVSDRPEEVPGVLGGVLRLLIVALAEVAAGDEEHGGGLAPGVAQLLEELLRLPGRLLCILVGMRHELRIGQHVQRDGLGVLVAQTLVDGGRVLRGPHGLAGVALAEGHEREVGLRDELRGHGLARLVTELPVGGQRLLSSAQRQARLVLHEAQVCNLDPSGGLP